MSALSLRIQGTRTIARRESPRSRGPHSRAYSSANVDRFNSTWTTSVLTSDEALERDLRKLVARSRDQRRNNDYVRHFDFLARANIVGKNGIVLRPRPVTSKGKIDDQAKAAILDAFNRWGQRENCTVDGRSSWVDVQNLAVSGCVQSGEFLIRKIVGRDAGPFGFALQILDPMSLSPTLKRDLPGGGFIRLSIEFDAIGRVVAYWIRSRGKTSGLPSLSFDGGNFVGVRSSVIEHINLVEEIGQKRGVPWVGTSLARLRMLDAYQEAALVAARVGANKVAWITKQRSRGYLGPRDEEGLRTMNAEPGTIEEVPEGTNLLNWDPAYPHGEYDPFIKRTLQGIASGVLVSYSTLANDQEGSSYASERGRKLSERDIWEMLQIWLTNHLVRPIFLDWLPYALAKGQVRSGGRIYRPGDFERLSRAGFQARTWTWATNPLQESAGAKLEVDAGFRSRDDVIVSVYGRDPEEVDEEIRESQARAESKKIALSDPSTVSIGVQTDKGD